MFTVEKKTRILIHTQYYQPEIGAPQTRLAGMARELIENGFEVSVLTAMPNYPTGKLFPGYAGFQRREKEDQIEIFRTFIFPTQSTSYFLRLLNYFSFVISSFVIGLFIIKADVIITESPPIFLGITGFLLSRIKKAKWIFNVSDLWPESAVELGVIQRSGWQFKLTSKLESFFYRNAWLVTGQSRAIVQNIRKRFPGINPYHLSNGIDPGRFSPGQKKYSDGKIKVVYAGLHGIAQGLDQLILAAELLKEYQHLEFFLIGDGPGKRELMNSAHLKKLDRVFFLNPVPNAEMPLILNDADILIVPLKRQLTGAVPSKLYEAMAAGKPVILVAGGEAAEIVKENGCGLVVAPGDKTGLVSAIEYLSVNSEQRIKMGLNGRKAVVEKYNRKTIVRGFIKYLVSKLNE